MAGFSGPQMTSSDTLQHVRVAWPRSEPQEILPKIVQKGDTQALLSMVACLEDVDADVRETCPPFIHACLLAVRTTSSSQPQAYLHKTGVHPAPKACTIMIESLD